MFPDSLLAIRFSLAGQLVGARLDDPVIADVERPVAPRARGWLAGALHAAADHVAPRPPVPATR
jgi:hypothetical protein